MLWSFKFNSYFIINSLMSYSVIISTNRPPSKILPTLQSLADQALPPSKIFLICDQNFNKTSFEQYQRFLQEALDKQIRSKLKLTANINSYFIPGKWVSYNRNYGFSLVHEQLVMSVDDDNLFAPDFCQRLVKTRHAIYDETNEESLLIPTERYEGQIRSHGYTKFKYGIGRQQNVRLYCEKVKHRLRSLPKPIYKTIRATKRGFQRCIHKIRPPRIQIINNEKLFPIKLSSANCLFGPTKTFQNYPFDERMKFTFEDFDCTRRITKAGIQMFVMLNLRIDHNMRKKTALEASYLADESGHGLYQKSKNRILFVKNTANFWEKLDYFFFGFRIQNIFYILKIFHHTHGKQRKTLLRQLKKGTMDGLFS